MLRKKPHGKYTTPQLNSSFPVGEKVVFNIPKIQLCEERVSGGYQAETESKVLPVDEGVFIFTHKRMAFYGEKRSLELPLDKIITLKSMKNGIAVSVSVKEKIQYFFGINKVEIWFIYIYVIISIRSHIRFTKN